MFVVALNVTTSYQNVQLFVYNSGTISNAYHILNNRGHYNVMFLVCSMMVGILFHSKNPGFPLDKNTSLNPKTYLFYFDSTGNEYEPHYMSLGELIS